MMLTSSPYLFMLLCAAPWIILGWSRIRRYARFFQLEGYDSKRYLLWLGRTKPEIRNTMLSIGLLLLLPTIAFCIIPFLGMFYEFYRWIIFVLSVALALGAAYFAPRDREIKQPFAATQRAVRLLVAAYIAELLPIGVTALALASLITVQNDPHNRSEEMFGAYNALLLLIELVATIAGVISYTLTPFFVPLANLINWPIEEAFRQYYLARARRYLKRSGATVIAITGSYGKTTTKHYLNHMLDGRFRVLMTPKSYNTLLGISRVINDVLAKDVSYDYFIAETDAYFVGENARICRLVNPTIGMVMTVGPMHLERLGSMENIAKAQYEVVEALPPNGAAFFNGDDPVVREMAGRGYPQTTQFVTQQGVTGAGLEAVNIKMTVEGLDFDVRDNQTGEQVSMHTPLYGEHNITNILMAAAVAHYLGMSLAEIGMRVTTLQPAEHRLIRRVMADGTILIDDSYSANPVGTKTALGVLGLHEKSHHRVVISAGMFELGAMSNQENQKLGERIAGVATDVILIGESQTKPVRAGLDGARFPSDRVHIVSSFNEAVSVYKGILGPGDALLMLTDLPDTYAP